MTNIYDAMHEKGNQIAIFQAQISGLQSEIEAPRVDARILEHGEGSLRSSREFRFGGSPAQRRS